jgi:hypothetical protein
LARPWFKEALSPISNLFASTSSSTSQGKVYYFQGEYSAWSVQQILTPADAVDGPNNHFGSSSTLNKKAANPSERDRTSAHLNLQSPPPKGQGISMATMFVGCGNCSTVGQDQGAI